MSDAPISKALYSPGQILLASIIGSPAAGSFLLAHNRRVLGRADLARTTLLAGLAGTVVLLVLAFVLPEAIGRPLPMVGALVLWQQAKADQPALDAHLAAGGRKASTWAAAGVGALGMVLVLGLVGVSVGLGFDPDPHVDFGHEQTVYYEDGATEADARVVGASLRKVGLFDDQSAKDVRVSRGHGKLTVSFILNDGAWDEPDVIEYFRRVRAELEQALGGRPVSVRLQNDYMLTKRTLDP